MTDTQSNGPRLALLLAVVVVAALALLGTPQRLVSRWAYAVEQGRLRADKEELAATDQSLGRLAEVSHAFRLAASVARPGVVYIHAPGDEDAHEAIVKLYAERKHLDGHREELEQQLADGGDGAVTARETMQLFLRLREITEEIDRLAEQLATASGSGIVFDTQGHILTNNHVISKRASITVRLADQREYAARVVGADDKSDLAVIKIDAPDLHPLKFGDSDAAEVGDWVIAVGAPFGLSQTVTHGIISAAGRNNAVSRTNILYQNFLQTDAAINPGNSGGPLLNLRGEVIGVNTAIATNDGRNAGVAFTIPANMAVRIANQLKETGAVARGWLGVTMYELSKAEREIFGVDGRRGVMVLGVIEGSPADEAGLRVEDVILAVDQTTVASSPDLAGAIADIQPGMETVLSIVRGREAREVSVVLGRRPSDERLVPSMQNQRESRPVEDLGVRITTLLPDVARRIGYDTETRGALIVGIISERTDTPLLRGEAIVSCNGRELATAAELERTLAAQPRGAAITLAVIQPNGERRTVTLKRD